MIIDIHLYTACLFNTIMMDILEILPESDLVDEICVIMELQWKILDCIKQGKHFGTDNLLEIINELIETKKQIQQLKGDPQ